MIGFQGNAGAQDRSGDLIQLVEATRDRRVEGLAPGDSLSWTFTVRNVSGEALTVGVRVDNADAPFLVARVERCTTRWLERRDGATGAPTYLCDGEQTPVDSSVALAPSAEVSLRVVATFPASATNDMADRELGTIRVLATAQLGDASAVLRVAGVNEQVRERSRSVFPFALTGAEVVALTIAACALIVLGAVLLLVARRRREAEC